MSCPSRFHSLSNSSALDAVPIMCIITHPVSECDCYSHFADKETGSERFSHFPQSHSYLANGPVFRCKPGKSQRQCSKQAGPRERARGQAGVKPSWERCRWLGDHGSGIGTLGSSPRVGPVRTFTPSADLVYVSVSGLFRLKGVVLWAQGSVPSGHSRSGLPTVAPCLGALRTFPALHPTRGNGGARDTHPPSRDRARAGPVLALNVLPGSPRGPTSDSPLCLHSSRFGLWGSSPASTCSPPLGALLRPGVVPDSTPESPAPSASRGVRSLPGGTVCLFF